MVSVMSDRCVKAVEILAQLAPRHDHTHLSKKPTPKGHGLFATPSWSVERLSLRRCEWPEVSSVTCVAGRYRFAGRDHRWSRRACRRSFQRTAPILASTLVAVGQALRPARVGCTQREPSSTSASISSSLNIQAAKLTAQHVAHPASAERSPRLGL